jgi:hypothetical protein
MIVCCTADRETPAWWRYRYPNEFAIAMRPTSSPSRGIRKPSSHSRIEARRRDGATERCRPREVLRKELEPDFARSGHGPATGS